MALFLAGVRSLDADLYRAAQIDGAKPLRMYVRILIPAIWPIVVSVLVILLQLALKTYDLVQAMTAGGPGIATTLPTTVVYDYMFQRGQMGAGSAAARPIERSRRRASTLGANQLAWRGSHTMFAGLSRRISVKNSAAIAASNSKLGGSCTSKTSSLCPRPATAPRKSPSSRLQARRRRVWDMILGTFAENRNSVGTDPAHRSKVERR